ncbi:MAG: tRNA (cytidine(34)-2'-O)-methyltransferase [Rhizobiales bacterium]|jgi:tRNA (cytidine/uridine-2'-O-)-methyltransferase|nr:tRNA (cytidine(34)-2'-O)-methyltransferase [Hyphomicrobiales bacterium]
MEIALYEPDIPQNAGTIMRLGACMSVPVHIIEPAGFPVSDRSFRRAGLDYLDAVKINRHVSFAAFEAWRKSNGRRLVLLTTKAKVAYPAFAFHGADILMVGRESAGVPDHVHAAADVSLRIPMREDLRSLNIAVALSMVLGEALRQTGKLNDV